MKKILTLIFVILVLFSGCTEQIKEDKIDQDLRMRINILYEHTIMMKEISSNEKMIQLGIDSNNLVRNDLLLPEQKIEILEKAYNLETSGNYEKRVKVLEDKMNEVMLNWSQI